MGSAFGVLFRVTTFGESHGGGLGAIVEGCPPALALDVSAVQAALDRRAPGKSKLGTMRKESDAVEVLSGVFEGLTLGSPIALLLRNEDADPAAYASWRHLYRPSHADFTYDAKYGHRAWAGGGRASARETAGRVAAGAIASQVLTSLGPVQIVAWVDSVADIDASVDEATVTQASVDASEVRCPDPVASIAMAERIRAARASGDTVGGTIRCVARGVPAGLGDPVFDKLEADLAKAMLSIPACKGFESGDGFAGARLNGLAHNDLFEPDGAGGVRTRTNRSGGIQGGISNGMPVAFRCAFKPVATVFRPQDTVDDQGNAAVLTPRGRHDPCVLPRAVPVVEAMAALVLVDHWLRWRGQVGS